MSGLTPAILGGFSNHVALHSGDTDVLSAPAHNPGEDRSVARNRAPYLTVTVIYEAFVGRVTSGVFSAPAGLPPQLRYQFNSEQSFLQIRAPIFQPTPLSCNLRGP
jgi:hypothetical protein